jgi:hypothetical protein
MKASCDIHEFGFVDCDGAQLRGVGSWRDAPQIAMISKAHTNAP